jgi:DNA-3-methyladenine glycosylase
LSTGRLLRVAGLAVTPMPRDLWGSSALVVARALLGAVVVHDSPLGGSVAVRLTEVEAYGGDGEDPGSHAFRGPTPRTAVMFGPAGRLYVYFSYGMHWCANLVCGPAGQAGAVLLRAGEVVAGAELARARRPAARKDVDLARGPARLAAALGLSGRHNGVDVCARDTPVSLYASNPADPGSSTVRAGPRVGVSGPGGDPERFPWRFWLADEPTVSPYRPGRPPRGPRVEPVRLTRTPTIDRERAR